MLPPEALQKAMDVLSTEYQLFAGEACDACVIMNVKGNRIQMSTTLPHETLMCLFRDMVKAEEIRKAKENN